MSEAAANDQLERGFRRCGWTDYAIPAVIGAVAAALRFYQLESPGVWFDESSSCRWIEFPMFELIRRTAGDCHPPVYWMLLKQWACLFGESIGALRSMSSLWGVATVVITYGLVRDLVVLSKPTHGSLEDNFFVPTLASLLVATSPFHVEWSQEMRMYSLGTFEVLASTWLLVRAIHSIQMRTALWFGYSLMGILSLYTLYFSLFTLLAHGIFVVGIGVLTGRWHRGFFISALSIFLGWLPWLPYLWSMFGTVQVRFPQGPLSWPEFRNLFWLMFVPQSISFRDDYAKTMLVEASACVIALLFLRRSPGCILVALCALVPIYAILNLSLMSQNLIARHRLILAQIFLLIGWAILIQRFRPSWLRWGVATLSVVANCWMTMSYLASRDVKAAIPGMRAAMQLIEQSRIGDDPVVFVNPMLYLNGIVYASDRQHLFANGQRDDFPYYQGSSLTRESDHLQLTDLPTTAKSVWVINADNWLGGSWHVRMSQEWRLVNEKHFAEFYGDIVVMQYTRNTLH